MKTLILEGIATSGKTTVKNLLISQFEKRGIDFEFIGEEETLLPILENTDKDVSIKFLMALLNKFFDQKKEVLIFDRLYFTHIFRTNSNVSGFRDIEMLLSKHATLLVLLIIDEQEISNRVQGAMLHRDEDWRRYVRKKGDDDKIETYYAEQQQFLLDLVSQSSLPCIIKNSTTMDFKGIARAILEIIK